MGKMKTGIRLLSNRRQGTYGRNGTVRPKTILIGRYRHACKKWILKNNLYNFPLLETDGVFDPQRIGWVFLHGRKTEMMKFQAAFDREVSSDDLKKLGYPVSSNPRSAKYALYKLKPLETNGKLTASEIARAGTRRNTVFLNINEIAETETDRATFTHWLHNVGTPFAKTYESRIRKLIKPSLMQLLADADVTVMEAAQQTFLGNLFDVPFPPPKIPKFTFIDLFAGIGGFRIAMQNLGGKCVFSSEWDTAAQKTYLANFGDLPFGDITKPEIKAAIPDKFDVLCAGFPCQPFSLAGVSARKSLDREHGFQCKTQGTLFFDIMHIVREKRPRVLFLENVRNLMAHDEGRTFSIIAKSIKHEGYSFHPEVIDASPLVPQRRVRCYMVCVRDNGNFEFPEITGNPKPLSSILEAKVGDEYTISDKLWAGHKKRTDRNISRGVGFTAFCADISKPSRTLVARYYKDGKECLVPQNGDNPRMLTPRECARLQGYDDKFILAQSRTVSYKQMGNSVAVPVIEKISQAIYDQIIRKQNS